MIKSLILNLSLVIYTNIAQKTTWPIPQISKAKLVSQTSPIIRITWRLVKDRFLDPPLLQNSVGLGLRNLFSIRATDWFSKTYPQTSSISILGDLIKMQITGSTPHLVNQAQMRSNGLDKSHQGDKFKKHFVKHSTLQIKILPNKWKINKDEREK